MKKAEGERYDMAKCPHPLTIFMTTLLISGIQVIRTSSITVLAVHTHTQFSP